MADKKKVVSDEEEEEEDSEPVVIVTKRKGSIKIVSGDSDQQNERPTVTQQQVSSSNETKIVPPPSTGYQQIKVEAPAEELSAVKIQQNQQQVAIKEPEIVAQYHAPLAQQAEAPRPFSPQPVQQVQKPVQQPVAQQIQRPVASQQPVAQPQFAPPQRPAQQVPVQQQPMAQAQVAPVAQIAPPVKTPPWSPQVSPAGSDQLHPVQRQVPLKPAAPLVYPEPVLIRPVPEETPAEPPPACHMMDDMAWRHEQEDATGGVAKPERHPNRMGNIWPPPQQEADRDRGGPLSVRVQEPESWVHQESVTTAHSSAAAPWAKKEVGRREAQWPPLQPEIQKEPVYFEKTLRPQWPPSAEDVAPSSQVYQKMALQQVHSQVAKQTQYFGSGGKIKPDEDAYYANDTTYEEQQVKQPVPPPIPAKQPPVPLKPGAAVPQQRFVSPAQQQQQQRIVTQQQQVTTQQPQQFATQQQQRFASQPHQQQQFATQQQRFASHPQQIASHPQQIATQQRFAAQPQQQQVVTQQRFVSQPQQFVSQPQQQQFTPQRFSAPGQPQQVQYQQQKVVHQQQQQPAQQTQTFSTSQVSPALYQQNGFPTHQQQQHVRFVK